MPRARSDKNWTNSAMGAKPVFARSYGRFRLYYSEIHEAAFHLKPTNFLHLHSHFEPCVVTAGQGLFEHGSERFALKPGDLFIANPHTPHTISSMETRDLVVLFISFTLEEQEPARERREDAEAEGVIEQFLKHHRVWKPRCRMVRSAFRQARNLARLKVGDDESRTQGAFVPRFLAENVLCLMQALTEISHPMASPGEAGWVEQLEREIDRRLDHTFSIGELARACGLSERHLRRLFKERTGSQLHEEILNRRMTRAARLLLRPEIPIAQAAEAVGIPDPSQFTRAFKKVHGLTPRQFRLQPLQTRTNNRQPIFQTTRLNPDIQLD